MPEKQSEVVVEVVSETVSGMVTRKHFDERFESMERKLEADMAKKFASQTVQFLFIQIALIGLLLTALAYFTQPLRAESGGPENTEIVAEALPFPSHSARS